MKAAPDACTLRLRVSEIDLLLDALALLPASEIDGPALRERLYLARDAAQKRGNASKIERSLN